MEQLARPKKQVELTLEQTREQMLKRFLSDGFGTYEPVPTYEFNIGDRVSVGNLKDATICDKLEKGIYEIDYTSIENNYGNPIVTEHCKSFFWWYRIRPYHEEQASSFIKNEDLKLSFSQQSLEGGILGKVYHFGVNFNPDYQRGYVWEDTDKTALINSIFNNVDIGKFVFIRIDSIENDLYECLDGQQRGKTLLEFFENKFAYQGYYYNDLCKRDQNHFNEYQVVIAETNELTKEQKLRYFLQLNCCGRVMDREHLKMVEQMLKEIESR